MQRLMIFLGLAVLAVGQVLAAGDVDTARAKGIAWLVQHQNGDGSWGAGGGKMAATSEVLAALQKAGADRGAHYARGLAWVGNAKTDSVDSLARKIMVLEAAGQSAPALGLIDELLVRRNALTTWGAFAGYQSGLPDSSLAMQAIHDSGISYSGSDTNAFFGTALNAQQSGDSGWPYMGGSGGATQPAKILPSAHTLIALADLYQDGWDIPTYIQRGARWLNAKQQADGSFLDDPAEAEGAVHKTALAFLALEAVDSAGIAPAGSADAMNAGQSFLIDALGIDGSWHAEPYQSALALRTLPAVELVDTDGDGLPDVVELELGTNPTLVDARSLLTGNGLTPRLAVEPLFAELTVGTAFSHTPSANGGTPPYIWGLGAGQLPPGIVLNTGNGALAGTPTAQGEYLFSLALSDGAGDQTQVAYRLHVAPAAGDPGDDPPLPPDDPPTDSDNDGLSDAFELANGLDPEDPSDCPSWICSTGGQGWRVVYSQDTDGDGLLNAVDNDDDGDGLPDSYELANGLNLLSAADATSDNDGDGLNNLRERDHGTSPHNADSDGDGISDGIEVQAGLNPVSAADADGDKDGDGLSNLYEVQNGLNPANADSDRDGLTDGYELDNGLDPSDGSDCPAWLCRNGNGGWRAALPQIQ